MIKVRALYHFLDKVACRNRLQGQVFDVPDVRAKELEREGLVAVLDKKPAENKPVKDTEQKPARSKKDPKA